MGKGPLDFIDVEESENDKKKIKGDIVSGPEAGRSPYSNEEYTVGWVSTHSIDMAAAKGMLDEEHGDPQTPPQEADHNTYLLGCMRGFRVVIACLPKDELGAISAAAVARDMLFTFPNIRVGLTVGVGAGIPHYDDNETCDIRLGDVVIGSDRGSSGVIVYDFGKWLPDGSFKNMYALDRPPRPLRAALARMEAEHQTRERSAVVKHAPTREQIKQRHGAICLEMEAAGLINNFPCIVIRGISNYADSQKNDQWHAYAASTAAACAKELLGFVQLTTLEAECKGKDVLQILNNVSHEVSQISTHLTHIKRLKKRTEMLKRPG